MNAFRGRDCFDGTDQDFLRLAGYRVAYLDADAVRLDFPEAANLDEAEIECVIGEAGAIVSLAQLESGVRWCRAPTLESRRIGRRQSGGGRTAVVEACFAEGRTATLDVKGCGVAPGCVPEISLYGTGLMQLGEALRDVFYESLVRDVLARSGFGDIVAPTYAVLYGGYEIPSFGAGSTVPAGIQVRRALRRDSTDLPAWGSEDATVRLAIEVALREWGLTTVTNPTCLTLCWDGTTLGADLGDRSLSLDEEERRLLAGLSEHGVRWRSKTVLGGLNVQSGRTVSGRRALVDFGHYRFLRTVDLEVDGIASMVADGPAGLGAVVWREELATKAAPELTLGEWGAGGAWNLARDLAVGKADRRRVEESITAARRDACRQLASWRDRVGGI